MINFVPYLILQQYDVLYFLQHLYTDQFRTHCFYFCVITEVLHLYTPQQPFNIN